MGSLVVLNHRERHKQELRQRIIAATKNIAFKEGGWQGVTIRKVAEQIEYSPPTIYEYFENKDALLCQLLKDRNE